MNIQPCGHSDRDGNARRESAALIAGGADRLADGLRKQISAEVTARYAPQLAAAGWFGRLRLRRRINHEIEREIRRRMPRDALYALR